MHHRLHYTNFKNSHKYAEQGGGMLLMQASDVTDRWLLIVQEIWCVGPPKAIGCSGNYQTSLELEGRECSDCAR